MENFDRKRADRRALRSRCKECRSKTTREHREERKAAIVEGTFVFPESKDCPKCKKHLPKESFSPSATQATGLSSYCRDCDRDRNMLAKYGLTREQLNQMELLQQHRCGHCARYKSEWPSGVLSVDHCHKTQEIRVLLCPGCNFAEGQLPEHTLTWMVFWEVVKQNLKDWSKIKPDRF